jgi:hypothetical protein
MNKLKSYWFIPGLSKVTLYKSPSDRDFPATVFEIQPSVYRFLSPNARILSRCQRHQELVLVWLYNSNIHHLFKTPIERDRFRYWAKSSDLIEID